MPQFSYTVDDEPLTTDEKVMTPLQILTAADKTPEDYYLVQILGARQESYKDDPRQHIHMHEGMKFITRYTGKVEVS